MKIESVNVARYRMPGAGGQAGGYGGEIQIVEVATDAGVTGRGVASTTQAAGVFLAQLQTDLLAPLIIGEDGRETTRL